MNIAVKVIGGLLSAIALSGGFYVHSQREALFEKALTLAEEKAAEVLGTQIKIGDVKIEKFSLSSLKDINSMTIYNVEVFDKNSERIAKIDRAKVKLKLLSLYNDGAGSIDEVNIIGAQVDLKKRADDSWNFNDINLQSGGESNFSAQITIEESLLNATFDEKNVSLKNISADVDCSDLEAIGAEVSAEIFDRQIKATGIIGSERQIINTSMDAIEFEKIIPYLPADFLPGAVKIDSCEIINPELNILRRGEILSYSGSAEISDGKIKVEDTYIENINGVANFTDAEIFFDASASSNGQATEVTGVIRTETDEPFFDIYAKSEKFSPSAIINNLGISGAVDFTAHVTGTTKNPQIDADIFSTFLAYENISANNVKTHLKYFENAVYLSNLQAETFGGEVSGEIEIQSNDLSYNAHVESKNVDVSKLEKFFDLNFETGGKIFADINLSGLGKDISQLKVYGEATMTDLDYQGLIVNNVKSSFYLNGENLIIDNLNALLPNRGTIGVDGTVTGWNNIDLNFYGSHVDMTQLQFVDKSLDISGLSDFNGFIRGSVDNPQIDLKLSAVDSTKNGRDNFKGVFFQQPYDSLKLAASGSLDGIKIDKFELEKDGKITWTVIDGTIGLTGERKINLRLDTIGARLENIFALIMPDQNITGNIDNTIRITGTIDDPHIVGYVDFKYGSYNGMLLTGVRGDYYLDGDKLRLQVFNITSPMFDVVLNGTFDTSTNDMDFVIEGRDMDLKRFQSKFPNNYFVEGHGTFEGIVKGKPENPIFSGQLNADILNFNGVDIRNVRGHLDIHDSQLILDELNFNQGNGRYESKISTNMINQKINGSVKVQNVDIPELFSLANQKTELIEGKLNSDIDIGGTIENPTVKIKGEITGGEIAGYDLHDVNIDINLINRIFYINKFEGRQGKDGIFSLSGTAGGDFNVLGNFGFKGPISMDCVAENLELGMFGATLNLESEFVGTTNLNAKIQGSADNPEAEILVTASGGIRGSTFDLLQSHIFLKNSIFDVKELFVQRVIADQLYKASAQGTVPIKALFPVSRKLAADEQLNLVVSLDDADLSLLPVVSDYIAWAVGDMDGSLKITGTVATPNIDGKISVNDGSVKIRNVKSPIEHINIATIFDGSKFYIEKFMGNIGDGTFEVGGGFNFTNFEFNNYNFNLNANALDIKSDFFTGPLSADITFSETVPQRGNLRGKSIPTIAGEINFDRCTFSLPSIPDSDEPLPEWLINIKINLGQKVHFYSSRLYDMFLTGSAEFSGTARHPIPSGSINVKRGGTVNYLQTVFDIREGEALFNQIGSFFPTIHFNADTKLNKAKIILSIDGSLKDTKIKLSSSPEMNETEIMQMLTFRDAYGKDKSEFDEMDILAIGLQMSILGDIEDAVKRSLGFDQFVLSRGNGSAFDTHAQEETPNQNEFNVFFGKYITDKIMLRYTQGINGDKISRYGLQYDINDSLGFTIEREKSEFIFGLEARYKF